jgi:hypothetical protein
VVHVIQGTKARISTRGGYEEDHFLLRLEWEEGQK